MMVAFWIRTEFAGLTGAWLAPVMVRPTTMRNEAPDHA